MILPDVFKSAPVVFAVKDTYHIMVPVTCETVMWVKVGEEVYYDAVNGVLRSSLSVHRLIVPMNVLNQAKQYTICYRKIIQRKAYHSITESTEEYTFTFKPIEELPINIYHLSDTHNKVKSPVEAGRFFQDKLDLLVLNGDVPEDSSKLEHFDVIYEIASKLTEGRIPVIFSRGNHDMRGVYADKLPEYTPTDNGNSYFTFRLGPLWGLVLDCGEDKVDDFPEYGHMICCEDFRRRETEFLKDVVKRAEQEYNASGVLYKLVISHSPFTYTQKPPFDIEQERYTEWARILREDIRPDLMLCGHLHDTTVFFPGSEYDMKGQACPVVIGSNPCLKDKEKDIFIGAAITLNEKKINIKFTDNDGNIRKSYDI
ncbi:MAG: metallophosphoesterase [Bacilli bacterium]|nr:metallophosphoesterase [Bacilli bacterium]